MSFLSTIKGFTRSSKKKNQQPNGKLGNNYNELYLNNDSSHSLNYTNTNNTNGAQGSLYSNNNGSSLSLRKTQSPSKQSVRSMKTAQPQQHPMQPAKLPLFMSEPFVKTALVKGSYKTIVQLPKYVDYHEWLALNTFESFNHLNRFYGVISEYVTPDKYPTMTADPKTEYGWVVQNSRTVSLPANQYIDYALSWMNNKLNDQTIFPTKSGMAFPPSFLKDIKGICRQMFRIIAHIYHNHFDKIVHLSLEAHWNSYFAHFISFVREFDLIEKKELEPLAPLIESLEMQGKIIPVVETTSSASSMHIY